MNAQIFSSFTREKFRDIEQEVQAKHHALNTEAKEKGQYFGKQNLPTHAEPINNYVRPIIEGYRIIYQEAKRAMERVTGEVEAAIDQLDDQIVQWKDKVKVIVHDISMLEKQLTVDNSNYPWRIFPLVLIGALFMVSAETGFNGVSFQIFGQNLFVSIIMAVGVSVALVLLFHGFKKSLTWAKTQAQRWAIIAGWIVFYTVVFYFLAELRQMYLVANGEEHNISKLMFILVNWLMLLATAFLLSKFPSWQAIQARMARKPIERKIKKKIEEKERVEKELSEKLTQLKALERDRANAPKYDDGTRDLIGVMARKTVSDFLHENIQYRSDGNSSFGSFDAKDPLNTNLQIHEA